MFASTNNMYASPTELNAELKRTDEQKKQAEHEEEEGMVWSWSPSKSAAIQTLHDNLFKFNCRDMQRVWRSGDLDKWIEALELGKKHGDPPSKELATSALERIEITKPLFARDDDVTPLAAFFAR